MHEIYVTIGRFGSSVTKVKSTDEASLIAACKAKLAEVKDAHQVASQVLVWKDIQKMHNLIAVYDIATGELTVL